MVGTITRDVKRRTFCAVSISYNFKTFFLFSQIYLPLQVKRCAITTYKHGIYEFFNRNNFLFLSHPTPL